VELPLKTSFQQKRNNALGRQNKNNITKLFDSVRDFYETLAAQFNVRNLL